MASIATRTQLRRAQRKTESQRYREFWNAHRDHDHKSGNGEAYSLAEASRVHSVAAQCDALIVRLTQLERWCWGPEQDSFAGTWEPYDTCSSLGAGPLQYDLGPNVAETTFGDNVFKHLAPASAVITLNLCDLLRPPGLVLERVARREGERLKDDDLDLQLTVSDGLDVAGAVECSEEPCDAVIPVMEAGHGPTDQATPDSHDQASALPGKMPALTVAELHRVGATDAELREAPGPAADEELNDDVVADPGAYDKSY